MRRLINVRLPDPVPENSDKRFWCIQVSQENKIHSISPFAEGSCASGENWNGDFLSPMAVDLQINGGYGLAFPELDFDDIPCLITLLDRLWNDGVEAISPTFVTCSIDALRQGLAVLREARKLLAENRCKLLGAHLEGPFLSKEFAGAHNLNFLEEPTLHALQERIGGFESEIALVTLAPELHGAIDVINRLRELDIVVSLGHSSADAECAKRAFNSGVTMLTHTFNAMSTPHHRFPGPIGEALINGQISLGLIADGTHVHPHIAVLLQRLAANKLVLISDAISPYGLDDGQYFWDDRVVFSKEGCCRLEDGTLAGVTLPLLESCKRLAQWGGGLGSSIWSTTIAPRQVLSSEAVGTHDYLIGKSLKRLLRWETNPAEKQPFWHFAY